MVVGKRVADSSLVTPQSSKRAKPCAATARDQVLWLSADPPSRPIAKCIQFAHPHVLKLFGEVKNTEQFRVVTKVFWLSYFAHQRGESQENRDELFRTISKDKPVLSKNPEFRKIWDQVHDSIMSEFVTKFDKYFQSWLKSPAGTAYTNELEARRKKKAALQKFDTKSLKEYKDPDGETYRGIEWGVKEIFDIFSPLSSIAEVVSVKPNSSMDDIKEDDGAEDSIYGDEDQYKWFKADLANADGVRVGMHWHELFSKVANGVMLQSVLLHFGVQNRGGIKTPYNSETLRQMITRIPTMGSDKEKIVIEFPTLNLSLSEWTERFQRFSDEESKLSPMPQVMDVGRDEQLQDIRRMIEKNETETMSEEVMDTLKAHGEMKTVQEAATLEQDFELMGEDVMEFLQRDFAETVLYAPEPMQPPRWTAFLENMAGTNIYGKIELMKGEVTRMKRGMRLVVKSCQKHIEDLKATMKDLQETAKQIAEAEEELGEKFEETQALSGEVLKLNSTVQRGLRNPEIGRYVDFNRKRGRLFTIPSTSSAPTPKSDLSHGPVASAASPSIAPIVTAANNKRQEEMAGGLPNGLDSDYDVAGVSEDSDEEKSE